MNGEEGVRNRRRGHGALIKRTSIDLRRDLYDWAITRPETLRTYIERLIEADRAVQQKGERV